MSPAGNGESRKEYRQLERSMREIVGEIVKNAVLVSFNLTDLDPPGYTQGSQTQDTQAGR